MAIANTIANTSVNSTIDDIQFPLFFGIANTNAITQCERALICVVDLHSDK